MILIITWTTFKSGNISSHSCFHSSHPFLHHLISTYPSPHNLSHANSPPSRTHPSLMHPWLPFTIIVSFTGHANHFIPISCPPSCISHYLLLFIQSATKCTLPITPSYHISRLNPSKSLNPSLIYPFPFHTHFTNNAHLSVPIGSMRTHFPSSPHPFSKPIKPIPCSSPSSINISRTYFLSLNLPMHATTLLIPIPPLFIIPIPSLMHAIHAHFLHDTSLPIPPCTPTSTYPTSSITIHQLLWSFIIPFSTFHAYCTFTTLTYHLHAYRHFFNTHPAQFISIMGQFSSIISSFLIMPINTFISSSMLLMLFIPSYSLVPMHGVLALWLQVGANNSDSFSLFYGISVLEIHVVETSKLL